MKTRRFQQVNVFTQRPLLGNALAVVLDGEDLTDAQMAAFARWTQLSETTFLLPPTDAAADYRVRIFTPTVELPFAGHPTIGSCHAWLAAGGRPKHDGEVVQQCGVGLVRLRRDPAPLSTSVGTGTGTRLAFEAPARRRDGPLDEDTVVRIARFLGVPRSDIVDHRHCDNGPAWKAVRLASAAQVLGLRPQLGSETDLEVGVVGAHASAAGRQRAGSLGEGARDGEGDAPDFEVRAFFPAAGGGLAEDPVTGSLNAALAQWLIGAGIAPLRYIAAQGAVLGRAGRVHVEQQGSTVWIGGDCVGLVSGTLRL